MPQSLSIVKEEPLSIVSEEQLSVTAEQPGGAPPRHPHAIVGDVAIGALKGVGNTVFGLGKMVRDYTPIGRISDAIQPGAFTQRPPELQPSNTAQQVGYTGEQIGEFFTPLGAAGKAKKAIDVAKSAGLTLAQTGSPGTAAASGALTAVLPGAGAAQRARGVLQESAEKSMAQALGATKEGAKATAAKIAPQMLERGIRGTRTAMLERAADASQAAGSRLGALYKTAAEEGTTISGTIIRNELQLAKDGLLVRGASGQGVPIAGAEGVIRKLDRLERFVESLGDDIPVDQAHKVKTVWDRIVAKAGLYGPKATASATDNEAAWAIREGAGSFRKLLNDATPDLAALNKEYAFWKGLKDVLKATELRTQAQTGGLMAAMGAGAGGVAGAASGDTMTGALTGAFVGAQGARQLVKLVQSPWWRTSVSGPLKHQLANALAYQNAQQATDVLSTMIRSLPAQARQAVAQ